MQMIVKLDTAHEDVEVVYSDQIDDEIIEKRLSLEKFIEVCSEACKPIDQININDVKVKYLEQTIIGYISINGYEKYLINQPEHERYITWSFDKINGGAKINFPNSLYQITVRNKLIESINAYMYINWCGKQTKLYKYAMPNMLSDNKICMGSTSREIENEDVIQTLENIIYSPYSHSQLNNVKGFANTESYFEYLKNNKIEEKHLHAANITVNDLII